MRVLHHRAALLAAALLALPAVAAIPSSSKVARAVSDANETSGRGGALLLDVALRIGDIQQPRRFGVSNHIIQRPFNNITIASTTREVPIGQKS